ncbi:MAG: hypothetical protein IJ127_25420 [Afipia sp.]|nr:hypothetical protein [Afipia sp.]MBS4002759.1 hypothetical protein [Afipia sp.]WIG50116.1 MAG: hypothetical protein OJF48_001033 [Afipia sp.]
MTSSDPSVCPVCGQRMTLVFKNRQKQYVCEVCDTDPLTSPKLDKLLHAVRPPEGK